MLYVLGLAGVPDENDGDSHSDAQPDQTGPPTLYPVRFSSRQRRNASSGSVQVVLATNKPIPKPIPAPTDDAIQTANPPMSQAFSMS